MTKSNAPHPGLSLPGLHVSLEIEEPGHDPIRIPVAHSWVKQVAQITEAFLRNGSVSSILDTSSTSQSVDGSSNSAGWDAGAGDDDDNFGIVLGTSTTAPDRDDVALGMQIAQGTGSGQLDHAAVVIDDIVAITNGYRLIISRVFQNLSGADITVAEVGLYAKIGLVYFCLLHDAVSPTYTFANGSTVTFRYIIDVTAAPWLKQFAQALQLFTSMTTVTGVKDTGGTSRSIATGPTLDVTALATDDTHGVLVGTGTTAVSEDDNALDTPIAHGNGAGQLYHQAVSITAVSAVSGGYRVTVSRQFDNNSGASITIREVGLVAQIDASGAKNFLVYRRLPTAKTVADGASVTVSIDLDFLV